MEKKDKEKLFRKVRKILDEEIEKWSDTDKRLSEIIEAVTKNITYYSDACFYLRKDDGSFQIHTPNEDLLPHRVEDDTICMKAVIRLEDNIVKGKVDFDPDMNSQICVLIKDESNDVPKINMLFYGVSEEENVFDENDISFIKELVAEFL